MTKVIKAEVESANSLVSCLSTEMDLINNIKSAINDFCSSSISFSKGKSYDNIRSYLQTYISVFDKESQIVDVLSENIQAANNSMIGYMGGEDELDTEKLPELRVTKTNIKTSIEDCYRIINSKVYDPGELFKDEETGKVYVVREAGWVFQYSYEERKNATNLLEGENGYLKQFEDITLLIAKLDGLEAADAAAFASLSGVIDNINSFTNAINELTNCSSGGCSIPELENPIENLNGDIVVGEHGNSDVLILAEQLKAQFGENSTEYLTYLSMLQKIALYGYSQKDPAWKYNYYYKFDNSFGESRCQLTSAAFILSYLTGQELNPYSDVVTGHIDREMPVIKSHSIRRTKENFDSVLLNGGCIQTVTNEPVGDIKGGHSISIVGVVPNGIDNGDGTFQDGYIVHDSYFSGMDDRLHTFDSISGSGGGGFARAFMTDTEENLEIINSLAN